MAKKTAAKSTSGVTSVLANHLKSPSRVINCGDWWVYKCNSDESRGNYLIGDWDAFFKKVQYDPDDNTWGSSEDNKQLGKLNKGDMVVAYQTNRNELVGVCQVLKSPNQTGNSLHLAPIDLLEPPVEIRPLKRYYRIDRIEAFTSTARKTLHSISSADAKYLLKKAGASKLIRYRSTATHQNIQSEKVREAKAKRRFELKSAIIVNLPENHKSGYSVHTKGEVIKAEKVEAKLLAGYRAWLEKQNRKLSAVKYGTIQCDGYEVERRNLIEAKASARRENIRMAVGQLLDYAFQGNQGEKPLGEPHKAILLPKKPHPEIINWLHHLHIHIIWREGKSFSDNANGQFS